ncbi:DUF6889 family protein [Methylobacterium ajmalii]|jgi:hypothetical protein|uniref:DUF6889 family protein n=1 Tax=Methylobacterium ajmalii TaxID=2738439 RepID=UPI00190BEBAD|nr:hypothetical protein [Methylobacterium ajmalii]MBK3400048.1 hypothetical protein [Methylobacterium ajmalii]MBK3411344.1 hypothetical protein [Methylobacterium ajmalii]MBK3426707.1 hypothetical protein [Methylobacterium ajmalii]
MNKPPDRVLMTIKTDTELYRMPKMNAFDQMWCLRAVEPILTGMTSAAKARKAGNSGADPLLVAFRDMPDEALDGIIRRALRHAHRRVDEDEWRPVWDDQADELIEGETDLQELLQSVALIVWTTLQPFFSRKALEFEPRGKRPPSFDAVALPDGLSWLLTPVRRGMCRYESLLDGTLSLADIALMNDLIQAEGENESRAYKAAEEDRASR